MVYRHLFFRIHFSNIIWHFWFVTISRYHILNALSVWYSNEIIFKTIIIGNCLFYRNILYHGTLLRAYQMTFSHSWITSVITRIILIILWLHHLLSNVTWFLYWFSFFILRFFVPSGVGIFSIFRYWGYITKPRNFPLYFIKVIFFFVSKTLYTFISHYCSIV